MNKKQTRLSRLVNMHSAINSKNFTNNQKLIFLEEQIELLLKLDGIAKMNGNSKVNQE